MEKNSSWKHGFSSWSLINEILINPQNNLFLEKHPGMRLRTMNHKQKAFLICSLLLVLLLPITSFASAIGRDSPVSSGFLERTTVRGFVVPLGMDKTGRTTHLFAIRMHYLTLTITGEYDRGVVRMRPIDVPTKMIGYHGIVYISASFRGALNL